MTRISHHVEPHGVLQTTRHYIGELVYGSNDGLITTFVTKPVGPFIDCRHPT